ncbi:glutamate racemase [Pontimicrobium sp. MEBiC01747]
MNKQPIGIFDSGVGGTSIWKEIYTLLPNESTIYLADSKHAPYGPKGEDKIIKLSIKNTEFLIAKGCKLIVVACNTATTNAIKVLRKRYSVPFIGIEPAIKPAALQTKTKAIGVLATKGTLTSHLFHETTDLYSNGITIIERVGEGIVPLIESGNINSKTMQDLLKLYMQPMLNANIDYLVLGCTHYPYLIPQLIKILPQHIKIIDSGEAVAKHTKTVLEANALLNPTVMKPKHQFFTNANNADVMSSLLGKHYNVSFLDF